MSTVQMQLESNFVDYWEGSVLTKSSFARFFSPTQITWYNPLFKQFAEIHFREELIQYFGIFTFSLGQSKAEIHSEYQVHSMDASFGMLGGYAALIW